MSEDCVGCAEAVQECASIIAALVRRQGSESVVLTDDELAKFTPNSAIVLRRDEAGVTVEVSAGKTRGEEEVPCGS